MRSTSGASLGARVGGCCFGSKITTASAAARSTRRPSSMTSTGSAWRPTSRPPTSSVRGPSSFRQSDNGAAYEAAIDQLRARGLVYACDCSRSTFDAWRTTNGRAWSGPGCPGGCRERRLAEASGLTLRVALGEGDEPWIDVLRGPSTGPVSPAGDLAVRDRNGNWTYALCVVVDDLRHGVDLVVRGEDLLECDARADPAWRAARPRHPADVRPPPARSPPGRLEAQQGRWCDRDRRAPRRGPSRWRS